MSIKENKRLIFSALMLSLLTMATIVGLNSFIDSLAQKEEITATRVETKKSSLRASTQKNKESLGQRASIKDETNDDKIVPSENSLRKNKERNISTRSSGRIRREIPSPSENSRPSYEARSQNPSIARPTPMPNFERQEDYDSDLKEDFEPGPFPLPYPPDLDPADRQKFVEEMERRRKEFEERFPDGPPEDFFPPPPLPPPNFDLGLGEENDLESNFDDFYIKERNSRAEILDNYDLEVFEEMEDYFLDAINEDEFEDEYFDDYIYEDEY